MTPTNNRRVAILLLLAASAALVIRHCVPDSAIEPETPSGEDRHMRAAVYDDEGAWNESVAALTRLLTWMNYTVERVGSTARITVRLEPSRSRSLRGVQGDAREPVLLSFNGLVQ